MVLDHVLGELDSSSEQWTLLVVANVTFLIVFLEVAAYPLLVFLLNHRHARSTLSIVVSVQLELVVCQWYALVWAARIWTRSLAISAILMLQFWALSSVLVPQKVVLKRLLGQQ